MTKNGCLDYKNKDGKVEKDISPLFYVQGIIRDIEDPYGLEKWLVFVNDHNKRRYAFELSAESVHLPNITATLSRYGITISPYWQDAVISHLLYGQKKCEETNSILYQNQVLGWYPFNGKEYYFYDKTDFDGNHAETKRKKFIFKKGDKETYLKFLKDTIFPSTELSLALAIGYSAIVVSRLNAEQDLGTIIVNLCGRSTTGKSTAEMLMCSPFMNPEISNKATGLCFTANNTLNAIFARIDGVFGVPFVIDDITTNPNINLSQFIYTLADGSNKGRLNGNYELCENGYGWSGVAITSSETPILDYGSQYQGLKVRVIQTQGIQWTKSAEEAELVKRTVRRNFGFTGKEFADFVASIDIDDLCDRYGMALSKVKSLMVKKDSLTDRLASKYAAIYLTVELLNEAFSFGLSAHSLLERLIRCEQEAFEERDNATKAFNHIVDFITRFQSRFIIEKKYSDQSLNGYDSYMPSEIYGKIVKYDTLWEVHLLDNYTKKVLNENGLGGEIRSIRQRWIERGLAKGDKDHNTKQFSYTGTKARYDCFIVEGGIREPESEDVEVKPTNANSAHQSNYTIDDSAQIDEVFGGKNGN